MCLLSLQWRGLSLKCEHVQHGSTPLHEAAYNGHEGAMGALLKAGANREAKDQVSGAGERESAWLRRGGGKAETRGGD